LHDDPSPIGEETVKEAKARIEEATYRLLFALFELRDAQQTRYRLKVDIEINADQYEISSIYQLLQDQFEERLKNKECFELDGTEVQNPEQVSPSLKSMSSKSV